MSESTQIGTGNGTVRRRRAAPPPGIVDPTIRAPGRKRKRRTKAQMAASKLALAGAAGSLPVPTGAAVQQPKLIAMWEQSSARILALPLAERIAYAALFIAKFGYLAPTLVKVA